MCRSQFSEFLNAFRVPLLVQCTVLDGEASSPGTSAPSLRESWFPLSENSRREDNSMDFYCTYEP